MARTSSGSLSKRLTFSHESTHSLVGERHLGVFFQVSFGVGLLALAVGAEAHVGGTRLQVWLGLFSFLARRLLI